MGDYLGDLPPMATHTEASVPKLTKALSSQLPLVASIPAVNTFTSLEDFALRHTAGTEKESIYDAYETVRWNEQQHAFRAWIIAAVEVRGRSTRYLVLVKPGRGDSELPNVGEKCKMKFSNAFIEKQEKGKTVTVPDFSNSSSGEALRVENPYAAGATPDEDWDKCMAFEVDTRAVLKTAMRPHQLEAGLAIPHVHQKRHKWVTFELNTSNSTRDAELGALGDLMGMLSSKKAADQRKVGAFKQMVLGGADGTAEGSLFDIFPHMRGCSPNTSPEIQRLLESFDCHQMAAYDRLLAKTGVCFVNGGPGAGKTHFLLVTAVCMQAKDERHIGSGIKAMKNTLLYMVDMNLPVKDAADKMASLYKELGWDGQVIRMGCSSDEAKSVTAQEVQELTNELINRLAGLPLSTRPDLTQLTMQPLSQHDLDGERDEFDCYKFSDAFLSARRARQILDIKLSNIQRSLEHDHVQNCALVCVCPSLEAEPERDVAEVHALTLHEAAEQYLRKHQDQYPKLVELLGSSWIGIGLQDLLEHELQGLYRDTLRAASCVFTTPVTASKFGKTLASALNPAIVIFDEAPHARELSTLIPIALFNPAIWLYGGDPNQTQPYVKTVGVVPDPKQPKLVLNEYASQLKMSAMERACRRDPNLPGLFINHRAHGGLESLASGLFYGGKLVPASTRIPESTQWLRKHHVKTKGPQGGDEVSRLLMVIKDCPLAQKGGSEGTSRTNDVHHKAVMNIVFLLLVDPKFKTTSGEPGTILILTPYKAAMAEYQNAIRVLKFNNPLWKSRSAEARTIDTAQGHEADVIVFDTVHHHPTDHVLDPNRLCVALTRARQAEFILVHPLLVKALRTKHPLSDLGKMVSRCKQNGSFVEYESAPLG